MLFRDGEGVARAALERMARQSAVDIQRIWKRLDQVGGAPWPPASTSAGAGSGQAAAFRLDPAGGSLVRGQSRSAIRLDWDGSQYVDSGAANVFAPGWVRGVWFPGEILRADLVGSQWHVVSSGTVYVSGTNTGADIAKGSSGNVTCDNGRVIVARARYDAVHAGSRFGAWWDEYALEWHASGECP